MAAIQFIGQPQVNSKDIECTSQKIECEEHFEKLFEHAQFLKANGKIKEAIEAYRKAIDVNPDHGWSHHCLAQAHLHQGDRERALLHYDTALKLFSDKDKVATLFQLAKLHVFDGRLVDAWNSVRIARTLDQAACNSKEYNEVLHLIAQRIEWLIDASWYQERYSLPSLSRATQPEKIAVALHYLQLEDFGPHVNLHWILDSTYIFDQISTVSYNVENIPSALAFIDAIERNEWISPHWIIDLDVARVKNRGSSAIELMWKLANLGFDSEDCFSELFDAGYYRASVKEPVSNVVKHYISSGAALGLDTHPIFHSRYYSKIVGLPPRSDAVRHYLVEQGCVNYSPNPAFDLEHYLARFPMLDPCVEPPISHFLNVGDRTRTVRSFDGQNYLKNNPDIKENEICPELHFLQYGIRETHRMPFLGFSLASMRNKSRHCRQHIETLVSTYYSLGWNYCDNVLVVSHSAGRTGAPLIALRLAEELSRVSSLDVTVVVFGDGPLIAEFEKVAHVIKTQNKWGADREENQAIIDSFVDRRPTMCFCNSAESRNFGRSLADADLPVVSLIHEIADHYETQQMWGEIFQISNHVVFPSQFVLDRSNKKLLGYKEPSETEATVLPQGLLVDNQGRFGAAKARVAVRKELDLETDEILVLGCGAMDLRKGIDLFLNCAVGIVNSNEAVKISFLWVGGTPSKSDNENPFFWATKRLSQENKKRIRFIGTIDDVEPYFQAADMFLLTSRSDPFPCVMHEALAAHLPIIYMVDSGGASELVGSEFGIGVPYEDVSAIANAVRKLAVDTQLRLVMGQAGSQFVAEHSNFTDYVNELIKLAGKYSQNSPFAGADSRRRFGVDISVPKYDQASVYFLNPDWGVSGVNSLTEEIVIELNARGLKAKILFTRGHTLSKKDHENIRSDLPIEFLNVDHDMQYPNNVHKALLAYFKHHEPCALVTNYDYIASDISAILPDHIGIVGVVHSDDGEHYDHVNRQGHFWNKIVSVSDRISERVMELNPSFADRLVCIRNGVSIEPFCNKGDSDVIDADAPIRLVYSGRIVHYQKRVERYVELIHLLESKSIDYKFDFVGDGDALAKMKEALALQVESKRVIFHDRCTKEETLEIVGNADIMPLLSDFEGLPMSMLEGLSCGCIPIVFQMDGGIVDFIDHGKNGFVCRTVEEVAHCVELFAMPDTSRETMVANARSILEKNNLTLNKMVDSYSEVIESVLEQARSEIFERPAWIMNSA